MEKMHLKLVSDGTFVGTSITDAAGAELPCRELELRIAPDDFISARLTLVRVLDIAMELDWVPARELERALARVQELEQQLERRAEKKRKMIAAATKRVDSREVLRVAKLLDDVMPLDGYLIHGDPWLTRLLRRAALCIGWLQTRVAKLEARIEKIAD